MDWISTNRESIGSSRNRAVFQEDSGADPRVPAMSVGGRRLMVALLHGSPGPFIQTRGNAAVPKEQCL